MQNFTIFPSPLSWITPPITTIPSYGKNAAALGMTLLFLPPYSPNLNLIERLGKFVKAECLNSHYYAKFPEFCDAISTCLSNTSTAHKSRLDTLLTLKFQIQRFKSVA